MNFTLYIKWNTWNLCKCKVVIWSNQLASGLFTLYIWPHSGLSCKCFINQNRNPFRTRLARFNHAFLSSYQNISFLYNSLCRRIPQIQCSILKLLSYQSNVYLWQCNKQRNESHNGGPWAQIAEWRVLSVSLKSDYLIIWHISII